MLVAYFELELGTNTNAKQNVDWYALVFVIMGVASWIGLFLQEVIFNIIGNDITSKVRV